MYYKFLKNSSHVAGINGVRLSNGMYYIMTLKIKPLEKMFNQSNMKRQKMECAVYARKHWKVIIEKKITTRNIIPRYYQQSVF